MIPASTSVGTDTALFRCIRLALAVLLWSGCADHNPSRAHTGTGMVWPASATASRQLILVDDTAMRTAPLLHPDPRLTLGRASDTPDRHFGVIGGLAADAQDRIYVLDSYSYRVRVYDKEGRFLYDIGRRGQGPGEFTRPRGPRLQGLGNGIAIAGDTLWVLDAGTIKAFALDGTYLASSPANPPLWDAFSIEATEVGLFVARVLFSNSDFLQFQSAIYDPAEETVGSGFTLRFNLAVSQAGKEPKFPMTPIPLPALFFDVAPNGGVYFTVGDSFHIRRVNFDGTTQTEYIANVSRREVTARDIEDFVSAVVSRRSALQADADASERRASEKSYRMRAKAHPKAKFREAIRQLIVSDNGDLLLRRSDVVDRPYRTQAIGAIAEWTWLSSDGKPKARLVLPATFTPRAFRGCDLYGTSEDDDGSQLIQRYSVGAAVCKP